MRSSCAAAAIQATLESALGAGVPWTRSSEIAGGLQHSTGQVPQVYWQCLNHNGRGQQMRLWLT